MSNHKGLSYVTLDVFTTNVFEGNPLAVVHVPSTLSASLAQEAKQRIAREFNYSETVFLHLPPSSPPARAGGDVPEFRVDIFVREAEIRLAGHPIIGTATHLFTSLLQDAAAGAPTHARLVTKAGPVELDFDPKTSVTRAALPHDVHLHSAVPVDTTALAAQQPGLAAHLDVHALVPETLSIVNGMAFVYVRLPDLEALGRVAVFSPKLNSGVLDEGWNHGVLGMMFYVDVSEPGQQEVKLRTRMISGTLEDPATGSASSGLAALLTRKAGLDRPGTRQYRLTQAVEMGRRSEIGVDVVVEGNSIKDVVLQGTATEVMEGKVRFN